MDSSTNSLLKVLCIELEAGEIAILRPTPASQLIALEILLTAIFQQWESLHFNTTLLVDQYQSLLQQAINLLPRIDKPNTFGFPVQSLSITRIESLFLHQSSKPCELVDLHQVVVTNDPIPDHPIPGESIDNWIPPIESSGDKDIDIMAALVAAFGLDAGVKAFQCFDRNLLIALYQQWGKHQEDPEKRRQEYLNQEFQNWQSTGNLDQLLSWD